MDIIKFIESKKKENTYFKGNDTLKRNIYWLEEADLDTIKKQLLLHSVVKRYLVKCTDAEGEKEGVFNARTTKQAYKQAKRHLHIYGDAEYSFTILDE